MFDTDLGLEVTGHTRTKDFSITHATSDLLAILFHGKALVGTVEGLELLLILRLHGSEFRLRDIFFKQFSDYPVSIDLEECKSD